MKDFQLRPYKIAAEIDTLFNNRHLTGIGELQFVSGNQLLINDEFAGFSLMYIAVHGEDDKIKAPTEIEQEDLDFNFDEIFNN